MGCKKKTDMPGSAPPAQIACKGSVQRGGGCDELIVDDVIVTFLAHPAGKLLNDLSICFPDGARIGHDSEIELLQILEQDIAVEGEAQFRWIKEMKDDDIIALEAKQTTSFEDLLGFIEQVGDEHHQAASFDLASNLFEDLADIGLSRWPAIFEGAKNLN